MPPETILNGRYLVGRVLGFGGFGTTYIAWDLVLEKKVAIKEYMPSDFATRAPGETQLSVYDGELGEQFEAGLKSFIDESRRLAKFNHEDGIVHIFDSFLENSTAYIVMEYLEGKTLKELLKERGGKIPYEEAVGYILPVLKSLDAVHQTGIIHRDIAPDNIFLTNDGKVKLIDFGASRYATTLHSKSLSVILKQGYAPEEQYRSHGEQGPWSDVYAVCATLYRAITGVIPEDALERCANDKLVSPSKLGIQLPQGIENAILNGLNTKAENRIQSAKELAQALSGEIEVQRIKEEKKKEDVGKWSKKQIIIASCSGVAVIAVVILAILGVFNLNKSLDTTLYATVPDYIGMTLDEAQADWASYCESEGITNISLSVLDGVTADTITGYEVNQIYAVAPEVGSWFKKAETEQKYLYVTVVLKSVQQMIEENQGKDSWVMQNLENYSQADAQRILESMAGVNFAFETVASEKSAGTVIRTEPAAGAQINAGDTITVYVSDGSQMNVVETVDEEVVRQEEEANRGGNFFDNLFDNLRPGNDEDENDEPSTNPEHGNAESSTDSGVHPTEDESTNLTESTDPPKYTLTVSRRNGISSVTGTGQYEAGASVTVTASVSSGYEFTGWISSNTSLVPDSSNVSYTFRMPAANITLTANADTAAEKIYNAQQLNNIRNNLSGNYKLMADINVSDIMPWRAVGDGSNPFTGTFDGNGYKISGITCAAASSNNIYYSGLFGACDGAEIKNVTVSGSNGSSVVYPGYSQLETICVGSIVGVSKNSTIRNCISNCTTKGEGHDNNANTTPISISVGGIVGLADSYTKIINCSNNGRVTALVQSGSRTDAHVGGITGSLINGSTVELCRNSGDVYASASTASTQYWTSAVAGGIVGNSGGTISTSYNTGSVYAEATAQNYITNYNPFCLAGGIAGGTMNDILYISDCYNTGVIEAVGVDNVSKVYAGGIFGCTSGGTIRACYAIPGEKSSNVAERIGSGGTIQSCVDSWILGTSQSSYPGFDFTNVWTIKSGSYRYPQLKNNPHR